MTLRVNGEVIPTSVILVELKRLIQFYSEHMPKVEVGRKMKDLLVKAVEQAIGAKLLLAEAQRRRVEVSEAEIDERIKLMIRQCGGDEKFGNVLGKQKLSMDQLRAGIRTGRQIDKLVERITATVADPTSEDCETYYREHRDAFTTPERVQARHILLKPSAKTEGDRATCISRLQAMKQRIEEGQDFADEAAVHSDCASGRKTGGSLGWLARGVTLPEFDGVLFDLAIGQVSEVFETPLGFHIVQKVSQEPGEPVAFEEVRERIEELLQHTRRGEAIATVVRELRKKALIEGEEEGLGFPVDQVLDSFLDGRPQSD